ncbi:MAG TPA: hypothetical protein EYG21_08295 [Nitrospinaceae bacterium]|jgi:methyl-CpG-binding domain protein 4|nr:hypothetical protein [Nitrospinaceae bacterium]
MEWNPPKSPWNLVQEPYFGDEWKILVCCILLNLTTNKQVRKILPAFFERYTGPCSIILTTEEELKEYLKPLGLSNKRAKTLIRFSREYLATPWETASELHGCGKYADDAWHIFCVGDWENVAPRDRALNYYYTYLKELQERGELG